MSSSVLELSGVIKQYGALRPLRIQHLVLDAGSHVAVIGLDQPAAEVLVNLITGATLPDSGDIRAFDRLTTEIQDADDWLQSADRFGIVSERAVLLDALSVVQNLALPLSLEIEPPAPDIRSRALELGREVGLRDDVWERQVGELSGSDRMRVRTARALALNPAVLLLEHPSSGVARTDVRALAQDIRTAADRRHVATLTMTMDRELADQLGGRVLTIDPASGQLAPARRRWFSRSL